MAGGLSNYQNIPNRGSGFSWKKVMIYRFIFKIDAISKIDATRNHVGNLTNLLSEDGNIPAMNYLCNFLYDNEQKFRGVFDLLSATLRLTHGIRRTERPEGIARRGSGCNLLKIIYIYNNTFLFIGEGSQLIV